MKRIPLILFSLFLLIATLISCSTRPRTVLKENEMTQLLIDLYKAEAIFKSDKKTYKTDEDKEALINSILEKYGLSPEEFTASIEWYADNIAIYGVVQDTVISLLEKQYNLSSEIDKNQYTFKLTKFASELPEYYILDSDNPSFSFRLDSSDIKKIDTLDFRFRFTPQGVDTTVHYLDAALYYKYKDTTIVDKKRIINNIEYNFIKPTTDSLLTGISAYVHLNSKTNAPKVFLCNIQNFDIKPEIETDSLDINNSTSLRSRKNLKEAELDILSEDTMIK